MLERTLVFVDTSYLLASFYNSWETGARAQLEIDLPEVVNVLGTMIQNQLHQPIHRQLWYDGIPDSGPHRYQRALRTCDGVQLRAGQLIEWGERRTQKAVDTRLVADMVVASCRQQVSDIVLVSGDADMIPGVQEATNHGLRVHLYGFGWDSMSSALRHSCDSTTILDPREDFAEAMQLQVLEGPLPPVVRDRPLSDAEPIEDLGMTAVPTPRNLAGTPPPRPKETAPESPGEETEVPAAPATPTAQAPSPTEASVESAVEAAIEASTQVEPEAEHPLTPGEPVTPETPAQPAEPESGAEPEAPKPGPKPGVPKPSMMAPRRKLRSRYVPLPEEVWSSAGFQTPFDVGQQYASWWYENAATVEQRDQAHLLSGGGLPPEIDRPLLQFACETLHEYTLSEAQRVNLRDGFHSGIRGVLISFRRENHQ
ncbi:NYN domain-containing protein [Corynebacterium hylobatis]|uniref:NYN domain-containing protein n=1 Tax=Corynebacterium hylobatis TaxID=1859290 RepID=A0A430HV32_9CORY|nr:NYN domain-containing protein [Corynebacterium hylobatis]RSZ61450.1 NYN domain-containing protein [Corynebacterium hylobatis]